MDAWSHESHGKDGNWPQSAGESALPRPSQAWKILIIDDEKDVHDVTRLALRRLIFDDRGIAFLSAYSALEAKKALYDHPDIAVMLLDVVMEDENAGLDLIREIRKTMGNSMVRIILRTGHPGQAPEENVTIEYDINDYREKNELTSQKLKTSVITALRSYRDLTLIDQHRRGLKRVIDFSAQIFRLQPLKSLAIAVLNQSAALSNLQCLNLSGLIAEKQADAEYFVSAAIGSYQSMADGLLTIDRTPELWNRLNRVNDTTPCLYWENYLVVYCHGEHGPAEIIYLEGLDQLSDWEKDLVEIFRLNASIAFDNFNLNREIEATQKELLFTLGEIAEFRSHETGHHVKRVAEVAKIIALKWGMSEEEAELVRVAAAMHDLGKLTISESILNKPGKLEPEEFEIMKTHSRMGYEMLKSSNRNLFNMAALIAREHHENYDGTGYPQGLKGEGIHIYSRIVALADVFDALGNKRVYKEAWSQEKILEFIAEQKEKKFDARLVDLFFESFEQISRVREMYPDENSDSK